MLSGLLALNSFPWLLLFARLGTALMFMPGYAALMVPVRLRLLLALAITFVLQPVLGPIMPPTPKSLLQLALMILSEVTLGVFIGIVAQTMMAALDVCGSFASYVIGLTNALTFDPVTQAQSQLMIGFLNTIAMGAIFATNTHHLMLQAIVDSYGLFAPGAGFSLDETAQTLVRMMGETMVIALRLAAPLVVFGIVFNSGLGLLNRLVPQMQVFFVGAPLQIILGLSLLMLALPAMVTLLIQHVTGGLALFSASH